MGDFGAINVNVLTIRCVICEPINDSVIRVSGISCTLFNFKARKIFLKPESLLYCQKSNESPAFLLCNRTGEPRHPNAPRGKRQRSLMELGVQVERPNSSEDSTRGSKDGDSSNGGSDGGSGNSFDGSSSGSNGAQYSLRTRRKLNFKLLNNNSVINCFNIKPIRSDY